MDLDRSTVQLTSSKLFKNIKKVSKRPERGRITTILSEWATNEAELRTETKNEFETKFKFNFILRAI